jgi:hypothetical protein
MSNFIKIEEDKGSQIEQDASIVKIRCARQSTKGAMLISCKNKM